MAYSKTVLLARQFVFCSKGDSSAGLCKSCITFNTELTDLFMVANELVISIKKFITIEVSKGLRQSMQQLKLKLKKNLYDEITQSKGNSLTNVTSERCVS